MHYRRLGKSGIKVSEISLGAWVTFGAQIDEPASLEIIRMGYEQGINYFDFADVYAEGRAEEIMGKALADLPRESVVLSSKVFWPTMPGPNGRGLSRKHIYESVHASLKRMKTDYLDIYYCHRFDPDTSIEEIVRVMTDLVRQGKIMYWGTSEWRTWQIAAAWGVAYQHNLVPPTVEQPQYNMFHRKRVETSVAPMCKELGIGMITWSPLEFGILTGKYNEDVPQGSRASLESMAWMRDHITTEKITKVQQLTLIARELELTPAQLAIAWLLRRKEVSSVITGATHPAQLEENLLAGGAVENLTDDILEAIEQVLGNAPDDSD